MAEDEAATWWIGNKEVVAGLEYWLEHAKKGDICYYGMSVVKAGDQIAHDFGGAAGSSITAWRDLRRLRPTWSFCRLLGAWVLAISTLTPVASNGRSPERRSTGIS